MHAIFILKKREELFIVTIDAVLKLVRNNKVAPIIFLHTCVNLLLPSAYKQLA